MILVTGANGFVGTQLCKDLRASGHRVRAVVRELKNGLSATDYFVVGEMNASTDWSAALKEVTAVVHLAARVHVMNEDSDNALAAYRRTNTDATLRLAQEAADAGVKRFIYLSSIKVNGEGTTTKSFSEADLANPQDPYAVSKYEAEQGLREIAQATTLEVVIIRPPLVYGAEVRGNFLRLLKLVKMGLPLPFAGIANRRSMVYLKNLSDAIKVCITHTNAAGKMFLVSDGQSISVADLIGQMAQALNRRARLFKVPSVLLRTLGKLTGKSDEVSRLIDSLQVDTTLIKKELQWSPPYSAAQGLAETVAWFKQHNG